MQPAQKDGDAARRARMVETQIAARGVRDPRVLEAMRKVPAAPLRRAGATRARLRGSPASDRGQPDDLAALHRRADDGAAGPAAAARGCSRSARARDTRARCSGSSPAEVYSIEILPELAQAAGETLRSLGYANVDGPRRRRLPRLARARARSTESSSRRRRRGSPSRLSTSWRSAAAWSSRSAGSSRSSRSSRKQADGRVTEKDIIPVRFVPMTGEIEKEKTPGEPVGRRQSQEAGPSLAPTCLLLLHPASRSRYFPAP